MASAAGRAGAQMPTEVRTLGRARAGRRDDGGRACAPTRVTGADADRLARWLAGLDAPLALAGASAEWRAYAAREDLAWRNTNLRVRALRAWAASELGPLVPRGATLLYPFAGPDALHAATLFPDQARLVLIGLEPVKPLPDPASAPPGFFDRLGDALADQHRLAFFRTRAMASDFESDGVVGALVATLARLGGRIDSIETLERPSRARIDWQGSDGVSRQLEYLATDLSSAGMRRTPAIFGDLAARGTQVTFLKAASFLLGEPPFARTAQWLVDTSAVVVQDDSGLPFAQLERGWALRFFGHYVAPGSPFEDRAQPELAAAFARRSPAQLPFAFGYHTRAASSHVLVASKER